MKRGLIIALLVGCVLGVWKVVKERGQGTPSFTNVEEFIGFASQSAVTDAENYDHIKLDYSVESLKQVDEILGRVHDTYVKSPSSVHMRGLAAEYGAYVGEVIRRSQPNVCWTRDSKVMGEKSYPCTGERASLTPSPGVQSASLTAMKIVSGSSLP
ncbi:MAG TPA: hypothetical protein VMS18_15040 [Candidatus Binatia bacterium]|nr:hypothetical protein [Candidatus Binatia bacterium]